MKNLSKTLILIPLFASLFALKSCDIEPDKGIDLYIDWNLISTTISFEFSDAMTQELIGFEGNKKIDVAVLGPDKESVVGITGAKTEDFKANLGALNLALDPHARQPTKDKPVNFTIIASIEDYLTTSFSVSLFKEGDHSFVVKMIQISDPPEEITITQDKELDLSGGDVPEDYVVSAMSPSGLEIQVLIPAGTIIKDADGNLLSGEISATLIFFSGDNPDALDYFPGGLEAWVEGYANMASLIPATYFSYEIIDQSGRKAASFTKEGDNVDLIVSNTISSNYINPENGQPIQPGDILIAYYYNDATGKWSEFSVVNVEEVSREGLKINLSVPGTYGNGCFVGGISFPEPCVDPVIINVTANADTACDEWSGEFKFRSSTFNKNYQFAGILNNSIQLDESKDVTGSLHYTINYYKETFTGIINDVKLCNNTVNIPITPSNSEPVYMHVLAYCPGNPNNYIEISGQRIWYRKQGTEKYYSFVLTNGRAKVCQIEQGALYEFFTVYEDESYEWTAVANTTNFYEEYEIPHDVCVEMGF